MARLISHTTLQFIIVLSLVNIRLDNEWLASLKLECMVPRVEGVDWNLLHKRQPHNIMHLFVVKIQK